MAFCTNCGKQLEEGALFCTGCGTKVEIPETENKVGGVETVPVEQAENQFQYQEPQQAENQFQNQETQQTENQFQNQETQQAQNQFQYQQVPQKKKTHVGLIVGIICGVVVLIIIAVIVLFVLWNKKEKVDLTNYTTIEYSGYNGDGYAMVVFDYASFEEDVEVILEKKHTQNQNSWWSDTYYVEEAFSYSLDSYNDLSNGDEITLTYNINNELIEDYKIELVGKDMVYTVEGLEELTTINPFEGVNVVFSGVDGNISAEVVNNSSNDFVNNYVGFYLDKSYGICVGDEVTVTLNMSNENAAYYGYNFTETEKTFVCSEGDSYVKTLADLDKETIKKMQNFALKCVEDNYKDESYTTGDWNYEGLYFLKNEEADSWGYQNVVYVVYSTTITSAEDEFEPQTIYAPVRIANIVKKADGSIEFVEDDYYNIAGYGGNIGDSWTYIGCGYFEPEAMYEELIVNRSSGYSYEVSEELQQYGN